MRRPRSRVLLFALTAAALGAPACRAVREPALESHPVAQYPIEDFLGTVGYEGASFSPDGRTLLVSCDKSGVFNAWAVPADGGDPSPLTQSATDSIFVQSYFPADERFLYLSDQGGNELSHLYVRERDGSSRDLTPGDKLKATFDGWSKDDRSFYLTTNERDARYFDLYQVDAGSYKRTLLFTNKKGFDIGPVSPDERYVALTETHTTTDTDVHLFDRRTGETRLLTEHKGEVTSRPLAWSPDGRFLYYLSDETADFQYLARMDIQSGRREVVEKPDWDVVGADFSKKGRYLWIAINADGRTELRVYEVHGMVPVRLPALPDAEITSVTFSADETRLAFYVNGSRQPSDLYVLDLKSGTSRALTKSLNARIDPKDLVDGEVVRFRSYDNLEVPGILYKPQAADIDHKVPTLLWVHGGPGGQSRVTWSALIQFLTNHGYGVFAINNRGSGGYGRTFYKMDDRKHGEVDLDDCVASKKYLAGLGWADPGRVGILGGSYGGYMVLAALAFRPHEFAVGVDLFGVANWLRTLKSIPPYWESFRKALYVEIGDPTTDEAYLRRISPLFHADQIRRPLLVLQGANDPRVLKAESDEIVEAVKKNNVPVEYVVFDDEGHGFRKKENQERADRAILDFVERYLRGAGAPAGPAEVAPRAAAAAPAAPAPGGAPGGSAAPPPPVSKGAPPAPAPPPKGHPAGGTSPAQGGAPAPGQPSVH